LSRRSLWYATLPMFPTLIAQGAYVAARAQRLPEAAGARRGVVAGGAERLRLSVIGESTAAGVGVADQRDGFAVQLARTLAEGGRREVHWQVAGRNGATVRDMHRVLVRELQEPLDLVVVLAGVNDTVRLTSRRRFARDIRTLHEALRVRGARQVVFSAVPPMEQFPLLPQPLRSILGLRSSLLDAALIDQLATLRGASHAPLDPLSAAENMASDGFHPNARGYALWAQLLAEALADLGSSARLR
ncbi:MAG: SGNH/GDSL hydrolase family protein, partial [Polyangiales bacterium]